MVLVTGAASSGKSAYAEELAVRLGSPRCYVATMSGEGAAARERIARHRQLRAGKGFLTVETYGGFAQAIAGARGQVALVEDLGNLVAGRLFLPNGSVAEPDSVADGCLEDLALVADRFAHVVVVGNEVGCDGVDYGAETNLYLRLIGTVACRLAAGSDAVVEVANGWPNVVKGAAVLGSVLAVAEPTPAAEPVPASEPAAEPVPASEPSAEPVPAAVPSPAAEAATPVEPSAEPTPAPEREVPDERA